MTDNIDRLAGSAEALRGQMQELDQLAESVGTRLVTGIASAVVQGRNLSDVMRSMVLSLSRMALSAALKPLGSLLGGLTGGLLKNADGNVFADGGVVNAPTLFGMKGGLGLMGEAGPEAVMPLARGADGKLGVRGGGGVSVTVNIQTTDVAGFQRSQGQVAAMIARAVARGQRNL